VTLGSLNTSTESINQPVTPESKPMLVTTYARGMKDGCITTVHIDTEIFETKVTIYL